MAVLLIPEIKGTSYIRLIEEQAHYYLPISKQPFRRYVPSDVICRQYHVTQDELMHFLNDSNTVHAVFCQSGALFLHPTGLTKVLKDYNLKLLKGRRAVNPFNHRNDFLC